MPAWNLPTIPKPNKEDYSDPSAYKPISLLPVLRKCLEKLILGRLQHSATKHNWLSSKRHGFQAGLSTMTAIDSLTKYIKQGFQSKAYTACVLFNIIIMHSITRGTTQSSITSQQNAVRPTLSDWWTTTSTNAQQLYNWTRQPWPSSSKQAAPKAVFFLKQQWREQWEKENSESSITKEFFSNIDKAKILQLTNTPHQLIQILSGHSRLRTFLHRIGVTEDDLCSCNLGPETI